ncbi:MAG: aminopeptidase P N-terminal domain-containing protein [Methylotenera sp.]|nr:aminopeptidase P N-terminal domain-containing protein [Oligoflexia bacterium]
MLLSNVPGYFKSRRDSLMKAQPGAAFIFAASPEYLRNPDVHFPFRQESNFYYLTGFEEPEAFVVMVPTGSQGRGSYKTVMFVRKRDPEKEMWEGERYGTEGAMKIFGADEAYLHEEFDRKLPELIRASEKIYYRVGMDESTDRRVLAALETHRRSMGRSGKALSPILDPNEVIGEMRLFKSPEEAETLRKACQITARAHTIAMKEVRPGMNESEIEALIDYELRRGGCQRVGYGSIVAGGKNAACLHYRHNNEVLRDGDLLLVDAGGEHNYYTSDITRTFPVGRKFTAGQAKAYDLVLKSQLEAIALAKPGATMPAIHQKATEVLIDGMLSLGLLKGKASAVFKTLEYKRFYPHGTGHWLGMDVHDVGLYMKNGEPRTLEAGMCFTIEPGFYVQPGDREVAAEFRNIGIRIEDDILITANGHDILTRDVVKTRDDIENLRAH